MSEQFFSPFQYPLTNLFWQCRPSVHKPGVELDKAGTNNIFGTFWNSPIYTYTNGINRLRVNGTLNTNISGIAQDVSGYFGIAPNGYFASNSPWSMLHLEGSDNTGFGGGGWRQWMKTGGAHFDYQNKLQFQVINLKIH